MEELLKLRDLWKFRTVWICHVFGVDREKCSSSALEKGSRRERLDVD